jgi:hypothetical protein
MQQEDKTSIRVTSPARQIIRLILHVLYKRRKLSSQLTAYSQSSKRVRISWQLGRFSGSAQQSASSKQNNSC